MIASAPLSRSSTSSKPNGAPPPVDRLDSKPKATINCRHCGVPVAQPDEVFCCTGCAYVYRLINEAGLDAYYKIKDTITAPADAALLPSRDYLWLAEAQKEAEKAAAGCTPELRLDVQGISCAGCVWLIERVFLKEKGSGRIEVNAQTGQLRLTWQTGAFDAPAFARTLQNFNYLLSPASAVRTAPPESRGLVKRIGLCTAFAMNVMLFTLPTYFGMEASFTYARLFGTLSMAFATLALLSGGGYFLGKAWRSLGAGAVNIDLPISLGLLGAYSGSFFGWWMGDERFVYFDFVSTFILLMLIGRWAQLAAVERNQRRLLAEQPLRGHVRLLSPNGGYVEVEPEKLTAGARFATAPGQIVPVEAKLITPEASIGLAWINGESAPRVARAGQQVPSGAVNLAREEILLEARQGWSESLLAELIRPVVRNAYRHRFIERVIKAYLIGIIAAAFVSGLAWYFASGDLVRSYAVVTAVLVVSCPCAIGLAFPLTDEIATVVLRKRGVFVRVADLWPRLSRIRKIVFDKTGTLTLETPVLQDEQSLRELNAEARQALFSLVQDNPHPVARCLHQQILAAGEVIPLRGEVEETVGRGVKLQASGVEWRLGQPRWALAADDTAPAKTEADNHAESLLTRSGVAVAAFKFLESVRSDAVEEVRRLADRNLSIYVLSGDRRHKVEQLVGALGLPLTSGLSEMSPHEKASWVEKNEADRVMVLGDGANDSLAFDRALCRGTPVVHRGILTEKADFYYLGHGINGVRALFEIDDLRRQTHRWLLIFSIAYNLLAVGLAAAGQMNPLLAAVLMPVSSLITLGIVGLGLRAAWPRSKQDHVSFGR